MNWKILENQDILDLKQLCVVLHGQIPSAQALFAEIISTVLQDYGWRIYYWYSVATTSHRHNDSSSSHMS